VAAAAAAGRISAYALSWQPSIAWVDRAGQLCVHAYNAVGADIETRTFVIDPAFVRITRASVWVFGALLLLSASLPFFLPPSRAEHMRAFYGLSIAGTALFALFGWQSFRTARRLPLCAVTVDGDGLWLAHLSKEAGLITWDDIESIRERVFLQRMDLLDGIGRLVLTVEYQLVGFETIRSLIANRARLSSRPAADPETFGKPLAYHVFHIVFLAGFTLLGLYVASTRPFAGYGGTALVVTLGLYAYFATVSRVTISHDHLEIRYPVHARIIPRGEIRDIRLADLIDQGVRHSEVDIILSQDKRIRLRSLGISSPELYRVLKRSLVPPG
jgi:hypothetical protein